MHGNPFNLLFFYCIPLSLTMATSSPKCVTLHAHPVMLPTECPTKILMEGQRIVYVPSKMNYVSSNTQEVNVRRNVAGDDDGMEFNEGANWVATEVNIQNARGQNKTLETNGFELVTEPISKVDFLNTEDVIDNYYPSCENLLKKHFGEGVIVKAFDHNIRINNSSKDHQLKGAGEAKTQTPLGIVHGDYTMESGPKRLSDLGEPPKANDVLKQRLGDIPLLDPDTVVAALAGKRRFSLINVWRSIDTKNPVEERPLACVDSGTVVKNEDLRKLYIHYADRVGENYVVAFRPQHNWCYFPKMTHDEAMLIKQWDSKGSFALYGVGGNGRATFAIHSAFLDPTSAENAPPRKSIEVRCAVIWEEGDQSI
jgi:hypothetical protein